MEEFIQKRPKNRDDWFRKIAEQMRTSIDSKHAGRDRLSPERCYHIDFPESEWEPFLPPEYLKIDPLTNDHRHWTI